MKEKLNYPINFIDGHTREEIHRTSSFKNRVSSNEKVKSRFSANLLDKLINPKLSRCNRFVRGGKGGGMTVYCPTLFSNLRLRGGLRVLIARASANRVSAMAQDFQIEALDGHVQSIVRLI